MTKILAFALCAGCVSSSIEASGSGTASEMQTQTVECGPAVSLDRYVAGAGGVGITVFDGDHHPVYDDSSNVTGEVNDSRDLDGASGTWRLTVDPQGVAGQFKIQLNCF